MDIKKIQELCSKKALRWTNHMFVNKMKDAITEIAVVHYSDKVA